MSLFTNTCTAGATWFSNIHTAEKQLKLGQQQCYILATEYFCYKSSTRCQHMCGDIQGSQQQLCLDKLVDIMKSSHWNTLQHHINFVEEKDG